MTKNKAVQGSFVFCHVFGIYILFKNSNYVKQACLADAAPQESLKKTISHNQ